MQDAGRTHTLAFADLEKLHDVDVQRRNEARRANAEALASKAFGYLTWLDVFELEVYELLLPANEGEST